MATYGAESLALNKDTKRLVAFERKALRRMLRESERKPYNKELMQVFGDLFIYL